MIIFKQKRENESQFDFHDPLIYQYHIRNKDSVQSIVISLEYRDLQQGDCELMIETNNKIFLHTEMYSPNDKLHILSSKMPVWNYVQNLSIPQQPQSFSIMQIFMNVFKQPTPPKELDIKDLKDNITLQSKYDISEQFQLIESQQVDKINHQVTPNALRPMIIITNNIEEKRLRYGSLYLASLVISNIVYECLMTANLSILDTRNVNISYIGIEMLCKLIRPNTEQRKNFIARLAAFSHLEGVLRFIEHNDSYKITQIRMVYGNELTYIDLEMNNAIHIELKKILNHIHSQEHSIAQFGLARFEYFPELAPLNYNNQPLVGRFFPLIALDQEFQTRFPSIHGFIAFICDNSQYDYYIERLDDFLETLSEQEESDLTQQKTSLASSLSEQRGLSLQTILLDQSDNANTQLTRVLSNQAVELRQQFSILVSVMQAIQVARSFCRDKLFRLQPIYDIIKDRSPEYMLVASELYKEHINTKLEQFKQQTILD